MAVAVPRDVVVVYDEPEMTVVVAEEPPVPVDDPDEAFHLLVWLHTGKPSQPSQDIPVLACIDNSMSRAIRRTIRFRNRKDR